MVVFAIVNGSCALLFRMFHWLMLCIEEVLDLFVGNKILL